MTKESPILHIIVVGFHHKKGCQVEFSHPPLITGTEGKNECPSGWKYLPTLALPDGSHNYSEDSVFFNLPSLLNSTESVYGVSCYRQIPVEKLKIRTADVTRSTVQKSVCVLTYLPLYGYIEVKLSLIADAFFEQGDFSCTEILIKAYEQLNACILSSSSSGDSNHSMLRHLDVGLSVREIILKWRSKTLLLFKLLMLQKRVVCFGSPVRSMCVLILVISSLYPKLLEKGFKEVACVRTSRPMSPMPDFSFAQQEKKQKQEITCDDDVNDVEKGSECDFVRTNKEIVDDVSESKNDSATKEEQIITTPTQTKTTSVLGENEVGDKKFERSSSLSRDVSVDTLASSMFPLSSISPESWNAPLPIYSNGHLCLPYLSLPYMDLLTDPSVLSYIIGTSNILFHQKKNLADIQIDVENGTIETNDQELKRQLTLTTEDLRFFDYIMRHVQQPKEDAEGSETWIREQFQGYILALLRTAVIPDNPKDCDHFNANFMQALKKTQCFQDWYNSKPTDSFFDGVPSGHPFAGTLSVADMKLKFAQTMHNTESGRKINQAVNTTSRAVGGAISQAKGAFSNWWSSITTTTATAVQTTTATTSLRNENEEVEEATYGPEDNRVKFVVKGENYNNDDEDVFTNKTPTIETTTTDYCEELFNSDNDDNNEIINKHKKIEKQQRQQEQQQPQGIIEIAKEAELLDTKRHSSSKTNHKIGEIFTV